MTFTRVDDAMRAGAAHLDATGARNTEIEGFFVSSLLAIIYAEYEQEIRRLVADRAARGADSSVKNFAEWASLRLIRSLDVSELKGILRRFDEFHKKAFEDDVGDGPAMSAYNNIVVNRHAIAHERGSNMTFRELEATYTMSRELIQAFAKALDADPPGQLRP